MNRIAALSLAIALGGCTTTFHGSAKVDKGPAGCKTTCDGWGMELAGMVKMGEYSDGCICQVKPAPAASSQIGGSIAAAAGVYMQMEAEQQQRQHQATSPAPGGR